MDLFFLHFELDGNARKWNGKNTVVIVVNANCKIAVITQFLLSTVQLFILKIVTKDRQWMVVIWHSYS